MPKAKTLKDWAVAVESSGLPPWVLAVLREYAKKGRGNRLMSRPRTDVADALNITPRRVTKAVKRAKDAGWMIVAIPARKGNTATYEGTFPGSALYGDPGTPFRDQIARFAEGSPNGSRAKRGVPHYYGPGVVRPEVARRRELADSIFTALQEREAIIHFSLSNREGSTAGTCRGCGGPLDQFSAEVGFTVGGCCAVVVEVEHDGLTFEEGTA